MLEDFVLSQPIAYKIMKNTIIKDRLSHAYLIEANGYSKKNELALAFAKYLVCPNHHHFLAKNEECTICNMHNVQNLIDIKIIKPDGMWIKKNQMVDLQKEFDKKPLEGTYKIYILESAETLNVSSSNSILKFLEEPEDGVIAILVVDNLYQLLPTIVSRCQIINLKDDTKQEKIVSLVEKLELHFQISIQDEKEKKLWLDRFDKVVSFATIFEKTPENISFNLQKLWFQTFSSKEEVQVGLELLIYLYRDILNVLCNRKIEFSNEHQLNLIEMSKNNTIDTTCDKINIIADIKDSIRFNLNLNLVMDRMIQKLKEV